jgi:hypothetical protein
MITIAADSETTTEKRVKEAFLSSNRITNN